MKQWMDDWTHLHMIIDTSRNGVADSRAQCDNWCNIRNARVGQLPSSDTLDDLVDAYFWIKPPGESDGCTEYLPSAANPALPSGRRCATFDTSCLSSDSVGTRAGDPYVPEWSEWVDWHVRELSQGLGEPETAATPVTQRNLFAENENNYYVDPGYRNNLDRTIQIAIEENRDPEVIRRIRNMKAVGSAKWFDVKSRFYGNTTDKLEGVLLEAVRQDPAPLTTFIVYDLPNRDCHAYASNGEICCTYLPNGRCDYDNSGNCESGLNEYKHEYIDPFAEILARFDGRVPVALVIEPDSLPNFATNLNDTRCGNEGTMRAYSEGIAYAVTRFSELAPSSAIYLDAAHGAWLGWQHNLESFVNTVAGLGVHRKLRGYALNVANYQGIGMPCFDRSPLIRVNCSFLIMLS